MIVVCGKRTAELTAADLAPRLAAAARTVIDVGTGDGRFAYATAAAHPDWLVIGMDAISERLADVSAKAARKPARGGVANVLFVRASAEQPPPELHHQADEIDVLLPWGALLAGTVDPPRNPAVLDGLLVMSKPGQTTLKVVFNAEPWEESTPKDMADLPAVTVDYVEKTLAPQYGARGLTISSVRRLSAAEVEGLRTTWSRRLAASHRGSPHFVALEAQA